jgi:hypothetical protein
MADLLSTFTDAIEAMDGVDDSLGAGTYKFSMATADRIINPFPPTDLTSSDSLVFSIATSGSGLEMTVFAGDGGDSVTLTMGAGTATGTYHFLSDGDANSAPSFVYIVALDDSDDFEDFLGIGLGVRAPIALTHSVKVLAVDGVTGVITLDHGTRLPSAWTDEFNKRGEVNLTLMGAGSSATAELVKVNAVAADASPPTLTCTSIVNTVTDNYVLGSRLGKLVANQFAVSYTNGVVMLYDAGIVHNAGLTASPVAWALPGTPVLSADLSSTTGFLEGAGLLISHGAYANYGLPSVYATSTASNTIGNEVVLSPDGVYSQDCVRLGELFTGFNVLAASGNWQAV